MDDAASEFGRLLGDLADEHGALESVVGALGAGEWDRPTPAVGWTVRDQLSHLAYFDEAAARAVADPQGFALEAARLHEDPGDPMRVHLDRGRALSGADLLDWWRTARRTLLEVLTPVAASTRLPWYGPAMSARSFVSARLMETWAHGLDVADAVGVSLPVTPRLRHVAHLGVRTRGFSYLVRGLPAPDGEVAVDLTAPDGSRWSWPAAGEAVGAVRGSALEFCLVVTQRRHLDDTGLEIEGTPAREWLVIAQAFAGGPGPGRPPTGRRVSARRG